MSALWRYWARLVTAVSIGYCGHSDLKNNGADDHVLALELANGHNANEKYCLHLFPSVSVNRGYLGPRLKIGLIS